jgi:AcrR family transcriptional regulator
VPRPRSLTPDAIAAAALAVLDEGGSLSMRTVAAELGLSTMALYRYVEDRSGLERLIVDLLLSDVDVKPPARSGWRKQIAALLERTRSAVAAHPAAIPLTLAHRQDSDGVRRLGEAILTILAEAGFHERRRVIAFRTILAFLVGSLQTQSLGPLTGTATQALAAQDAYPMLADTARTARGINQQQEFQLGLDIILDGLEAKP